MREASILPACEYNENQTENRTNKQGRRHHRQAHVSWKSLESDVQNCRVRVRSNAFLPKLAQPRQKACLRDHSAIAACASCRILGHRQFDVSSERGYIEARSHLDKLQPAHLYVSSLELPAQINQHARRNTRRTRVHWVKLCEQELKWSDMHFEHPVDSSLWRSPEIADLVRQTWTSWF